MNLHNIKRCCFPKETKYTLKQLQSSLDSFDTDSKPTAQDHLNYLKQNEESINKRKNS